MPNVLLLNTRFLLLKTHFLLLDTRFLLMNSRLFMNENSSRVTWHSKRIKNDSQEFTLTSSDLLFYISLLGEDKSVSRKCTFKSSYIWPTSSDIVSQKSMPEQIYFDSNTQKE